MSKIKFNKEWFNNNKVAIHCKTEDESILLTRELHKVDIEVNWDMFSIYYRYENKTCYDCSGNWISYANIGYYIDKDYTIIKFSDLEFESEYELNEDNLEYKKLDSSFNKLKDVISANPPNKSEPIIETNEQYKRTISLGDVELSTGDIISINNNKTGIVIGDCVSWNDGNWQHISDKLYDSLVWIIPSESLKTDKGYEVSKLLFENELVRSLKDLIIRVEDTPKEIETKTYKVKFTTMNIKLSDIYICDEILEVGDYVTIDCGTYAYQYGKVYSIIIDKSSQDIIDNTYDKVTKIK